VKGGRKTEKADARGGGFFLLPHCLLASAALRTASPRAVKVLLTLCLKHNGFNNGSIGLGFREMATLIDSQNHQANSRALCQLIERGLLALECSHPRGKRLANEYRLTFIPTADGPATNDYLQWQPGDAGTRLKAQPKSRVAKSSTRTAPRVAETPTGKETSRCENLNGVHAKPPISDLSPVAVPSTHIGLPSVGLSASRQKSPSHGDGPISAAPDPAELRGRVLAVLEDAERGSQGQLAALAAIRPAALSKFLHNDGPLNEQSRLRLTLALPKVAGPNLERLTA
jgi:hypothetical protein